MRAMGSWRCAPSTLLANQLDRACACGGQQFAARVRHYRRHSDIQRAAAALLKTRAVELCRALVGPRPQHPLAGLFERTNPVGGQPVGDGKDSRISALPADKAVARPDPQSSIARHKQAADVVVREVMGRAVMEWRCDRKPGTIRRQSAPGLPQSQAIQSHRESGQGRGWCFAAVRSPSPTIGAHSWPMASKVQARMRCAPIP